MSHDPCAAIAWKHCLQTGTKIQGETLPFNGDIGRSKTIPSTS